MTSFVLTPRMVALVEEAKKRNGTLTNIPVKTTGLIYNPESVTPDYKKRQRYVKLQPAEIVTSKPVAPDTVKTTLATPTETITAVHDTSGDVKTLKVTDNKLLWAAAAVAAFVLLG